MQDQYRDSRNRRHYDGYMDSIIGSNKEVVQALEHLPENLRKWDLRPRWKKMLERLDKTEVEAVLHRIEERAEKMAVAFGKVLEGVTDSKWQEELINTLTDTLSMNWQSQGDFSTDSIMGVIAGDAGLSGLKPEEKMQTINAMKISSWITLVDCSPSEVFGFAMEYAKAGATDENRDAFTGKANEKFKNLHLSREMGETLFDLAKKPELVGELDSKGYILKPSYTA
jgi:hypothetical protein